MTRKNASPRNRPALPWLAAAIALCGFPIAARLGRPLGEQIFLPVTPLDRTDGERARQWAFLESCRPYLPPTATMTVIAGDTETEMSLFMMAIGAYPRSIPFPTSYWGKRMPEVGRQADFILAYRRTPPGDWPVRLVATVENGAVYARGAAR